MSLNERGASIQLIIGRNQATRLRKKNSKEVLLTQLHTSHWNHSWWYCAHEIQSLAWCSAMQLHLIISWTFSCTRIWYANTAHTFSYNPHEMSTVICVSHPTSSSLYSSAINMRTYIRNDAYMVGLGRVGKRHQTNWSVARRRRPVWSHCQRVDWGVQTRRLDTLRPTHTNEMSSCYNSYNTHTPHTHTLISHIQLENTIPVFSILCFALIAWILPFGLINILRQDWKHQRLLFWANYIHHLCKLCASTKSC